MFVIIKGFKIASQAPRYYTRFQAKKMAEQNTEIENLKRTNEDLTKKLNEAMERINELSMMVTENTPVHTGTPIHAPGYTPDATRQDPPTLHIPVPPMDAQNQYQPPPPHGTYPYPPLPHTGANASGFVYTTLPTQTTQPIQAPITNAGTTSANPVVLDPESSKEASPDSKMLSMLEERLKAVEGAQHYRAMNAVDITLVPGIVIPPKFKVPDFEKCNGTRCPQEHLTSYVRKMAAYAHDDKLLIHFFQDSLSGAVLRWYNQLDRVKVQSWSDLVKAFVTQYKHMTDLAPDRLTLQTMEKKSTETFKEYAQRWRDVAAQVDPPLTERESNYTFIETLKGPLYDRLVTSISGSFADIVVVGECLEKAIKSGKISSGDSSGEKKERSLKKKEGEVHAMGYEGYRHQYQQQNYRPFRHQYPSNNYIPFQNTYRHQYPSNNYTPPQNSYRHPYPAASHAQLQNTYQYPVSNATYSTPRPSTWNQGNTQKRT